MSLSQEKHREYLIIEIKPCVLKVNPLPIVHTWIFDFVTEKEENMTGQDLLQNLRACWIMEWL